MVRLKPQETALDYAVNRGETPVWTRRPALHSKDHWQKAGDLPNFGQTHAPALFIAPRKSKNLLKFEKRKLELPKPPMRVVIIDFGIHVSLHAPKLGALKLKNLKNQILQNYSVLTADAGGDYTAPRKKTGW